jgi:DnaJ-class molecular chaperone
MTNNHHSRRYPQRCRWCNGNGHHGPKTGRRYQACRKCRGRGYLG